MMISKGDINKIFKQEDLNVNIKETLFEYNLKIKSKNPFCDLSELIRQLDKIPERDVWSLSAIFSSDFTSRVIKGSDYIVFLTEVEQNNKDFNENDEFEIEVNIKKQFTNNQISIYNYDIMKNFFFNKKHTEFLELFCDLKEEHNYLHFTCLNDQVELITKFIYITEDNQTNKGEDCNHAEYFEKRDQICNINWKKYMNLHPNDFKVSANKNIDEATLRYFKTLELLLSIISIADFSTIENNLLKINIYGFRMVECKIDLSDEILSNIEFVKIVSWLLSIPLI